MAYFSLLAGQVRGVAQPSHTVINSDLPYILPYSGCEVSLGQRKIHTIIENVEVACKGCGLVLPCLYTSEFVLRQVYTRLMLLPGESQTTSHRNAFVRFTTALGEFLKNKGSHHQFQRSPDTNHASKP